MDNTKMRKETEESSLTFKDLYYKYVRYTPLVILGIIAALIIAWIYLRYATPVYQSRSILYIQKKEGSKSTDGLEALFFATGSSDITSEMQVLKSSALMERVVKNMGLKFSYYAIGRIKDELQYESIPFRLEANQLLDSSKRFSLSVNMINANTFTVKGVKGKLSYDSSFTTEFGELVIRRNGSTTNSQPSPIGEYRAEYLPIRKAALSYASMLNVSPIEQRSNVLTLSLKSLNPDLGAEILNQLMSEYAEQTKELQNRTFNLQLNFINDRLDTLNNQLNHAKQRVIDYSKNNNIIDIQLELTGNYNNLDQTGKTIFEQNLLLKDIENSKVYLSDKANQFTDIIIATPLALKDASLNFLSQSYNEAQYMRKDLLSTGVPATHPKVTEIEEKVELLRKGILSTLQSLQKSYEGNLKRLQSQSRVSKSDLKALPVKTKEYLDLTNQVEYRQALYNLLLEQREQVSIKKAAVVENSQIIEKAYPNVTPMKPKKMIIYILSFLLGLIVPAAFAYLREMMNDKVRSRADVDKLTTVPVVGEIGHSEERATLIVTKTSRKIVAEQFRNMRSNLQYIAANINNPTILVTSSFSGEGKSFISTNMGAAMSLAGKKTIILEFDIRKPKIMTGLNMPKSSGITNYLVGKVENLDTLIQPVHGYENLFVLGCGPIPPNPSELLLQEKLDSLFIELKRKFDIVIIDTAPVGMVSDAMTLGKFADCSFFIIRQNYTFKKQLQMIDDFYREKKLPNISIVINDVKASGGYGYGGYGGYGYGAYGYGYGGYFDEKTKKTGFFHKIISLIDIRKLFKR